MSYRLQITLTFELLHHHEAEVLVADVQHQAWPALVDTLRHVSLHQKIIDLVAIASIMLVHQVEWVPLEIEIFVDGLALSEGVERFVQKNVEIKLEGLIKAFLGHVISKN